MIVSAEDRLAGTSGENILRAALFDAVDRDVDVAARFADAKEALGEVVDLASGENQIIRNTVLVLESIAAGGFAALAGALTT